MTDFVYRVPVHYLYYGHYAVYYADTTPVLRQYYADTTPLLRAVSGFSFLAVFRPPDGPLVTRDKKVVLCTTPILRRYYAETTPRKLPQMRAELKICTTPFTTPILRRYYAGTTPILRRPCAQKLHPCWGFLDYPAWSRWVAGILLMTLHLLRRGFTKSVIYMYN